jgi:3-oxoacyl-[acyl-carrier protein] reductase
MELENKIALITGSGRGIGKGIALGMVKEGAKVIIADINPETAESTTKELKENGYEAEFVVGDICVKKDAEKMVKAAVDNFGRLDILVNNAGVAKIGPIDEMSEEDWDICMDTCSKGVFLCTQAAVKLMKKQNEGSILNITSMHGLQGMIERGPYSVAKAGIINLTRTLAAELGEWNIRVNSVAPGFTWTEQFEYQVSLGTVEPESLKSRIPLGRIGKLEDVANATIFLVSDKASYITGITLPVDGGWLADGGRGISRPTSQKSKK